MIYKFGRGAHKALAGRNKALAGHPTWKIGSPYNGYIKYININPYYKVDEFIPTIGKEWEWIDPGTHEQQQQNTNKNDMNHEILVGL